MNKRMKSLFSLILCVGLLLSLALPAYAEEEPEEEAAAVCEIGSLEEFLTFAENCRLDSYSLGLEVRLTADIDLAKAEFAGVPIFSGSFDGAGYTISGLAITADGSDMGLFRYLTDTAVVQNLHVEGRVQPQGSRSAVGGIAGSSAGQIRSCTFSGTVSGGESIGGLVGVNSLTGIIEDCRMEGTVSGNHFVGGLAGENDGVIRSCINTAQINTTSQQNTVEISDITLESLMDTEAANTVTDIGGIAGTSSGVIRNCENRGDVGYKHMGYNIGGIAGTQSGYIAGCQNYGAVSGRKEVGGIVGQMEPMALVDYDEDALQLLRSQLEAMGQTTNQTAANVRGTASALNAQVESIQNSIWDAEDAVSALLPQEGGDFSLPDEDSIQAAQNALSNSLTDIEESLNGMSATTDSALGTLTNNLYTLQSQISAMSATLGNVSQNLGGSIEDVSDLDTELDLTGKVENCVNGGAVLADRNAGGIAGAMALENDLDPEDDVDVSGESSLNFVSQLRAVILNCRNEAEITATKQNAGGIVGWMSLGLVKNSVNTGALNAEGAEYVGGVAGRALGYVRSSSAKCQIAGDAYVGGIAGSGAIVTDCRSMISLTSGSEKLGAVLGMEEQNGAEEEEPVRGNFYLVVDADLGGIDGISYSGRAEALSRTAFLALEELPEMFRNVTLSFRYEDGTVKTVTVATGGTVNESSIPKLASREGYTAQWDGLKKLDLRCVTFDALLTAEYTPLASTIASGAVRDDMPLLLLQGTFPEDTVVSLAENTDIPGLEQGQTMLDNRTFGISGDGKITAARYLLPRDCDPERVSVLVRSADGSWRQAEAQIQGSYVVFGLEDGDGRFALVEDAAPVWTNMLMICAAVLVLAAAAVLIARRKAKKAKKQPESK